MFDREISGGCHRVRPPERLRTLHLPDSPALDHRRPKDVEA